MVETTFPAIKKSPSFHYHSHSEPLLLRGFFQPEHTSFETTWEGGREKEKMKFFLSLCRWDRFFFGKNYQFFPKKKPY